jgi:hypothetical protein
MSFYDSTPTQVPEVSEVNINVNERGPRQPVEPVHLNANRVTVIITRIIKYLVEGLAVAVAALLIPKKAPHWKEVVLIGATAAAIFAVLDLFAPAVGQATRQGAGFGVGAGLVGFPGVSM